jgi:tight adherence protein B
MFKEIFAQFFKEKNTIGEDEAFANLNRFVNSKELLIFALAVKIGRASGGRFSNTLEKVEKTIQYRKKMQQKVDVITREGSIGSYIVALIAVFLYFALDVNFNGKLHDYFMTSEYGRFQLLMIFIWIFLGLVANKFITRIEK